MQRKEIEEILSNGHFTDGTFKLMENIMNCVHAKTIYTGKSVIEDAYFLFDGHQIADVSKAKQGKLLGECAVLTPAFIDPHSHIGMARAGEPSDESEAND